MDDARAISFWMETRQRGPGAAEDCEVVTKLVRTKTRHHREEPQTLAGLIIVSRIMWRGRALK